MNPNLESYTARLAKVLQERWESAVRTDIRNQLNKAKDSDLRDNLKMHLQYQDQGVYDYGRHYRVLDKNDRWAIAYDCNVTGMPMIHCVVNKETGDLARRCIKLVEEPFFQYNLLDERSRAACYTVADIEGNYLG